MCFFSQRKDSNASSSSNEHPFFSVRGSLGLTESGRDSDSSRCPTPFFSLKHSESLLNGGNSRVSNSMDIFSIKTSPLVRVLPLSDTEQQELSPTALSNAEQCSFTFHIEILEISNLPPSLLNRSQRPDIYAVVQLNDSSSSACHFFSDAAPAYNCFPVHAPSSTEKHNYELQSEQLNCVSFKRYNSGTSLYPRLRRTGIFRNAPNKLNFCGSAAFEFPDCTRSENISIHIYELLYSSPNSTLHASCNRNEAKKSSSCTDLRKVQPVVVSIDKPVRPASCVQVQGNTFNLNKLSNTDFALEACCVGFFNFVAGAAGALCGASEFNCMVPNEFSTTALGTQSCEFERQVPRVTVAWELKRVTRKERDRELFSIWFPFYGTDGVCHPGFDAVEASENISDIRKPQIKVKQQSVLNSPSDSNSVASRQSSVFTVDLSEWDPFSGINKGGNSLTPPAPPEIVDEEIPLLPLPEKNVHVSIEAQHALKSFNGADTPPTMSNQTVTPQIQPNAFDTYANYISTPVTGNKDARKSTRFKEIKKFSISVTDDSSKQDYNVLENDTAEPKRAHKKRSRKSHHKDNTEDMELSRQGTAIKEKQTCAASVALSDMSFNYNSQNTSHVSLQNFTCTQSPLKKKLLEEPQFSSSCGKSLFLAEKKNDLPSPKESDSKPLTTLVAVNPLKARPNPTSQNNSLSSQSYLEFSPSPAKVSIGDFPIKDGRSVSLSRGVDSGEISPHIQGDKHTTSGTEMHSSLTDSVSISKHIGHAGTSEVSEVEEIELLSPTVPPPPLADPPPMDYLTHESLGVTSICDCYSFNVSALTSIAEDSGGDEYKMKGNFSREYSSLPVDELSSRLKVEEKLPTFENENYTDSSRRLLIQSNTPLAQNISFIDQKVTMGGNEISPPPFLPKEEPLEESPLKHPFLLDRKDTHCKASDLSLENTKHLSLRASHSVNDCAQEVEGGRRTSMTGFLLEKKSVFLRTPSIGFSSNPYERHHMQEKIVLEALGSVNRYKGVGGHGPSFLKAQSSPPSQAPRAETDEAVSQTLTNGGGKKLIRNFKSSNQANTLATSKSSQVSKLKNVTRSPSKTVASLPAHRAVVKSSEPQKKNSLPSKPKFISNKGTKKRASAQQKEVCIEPPDPPPPTEPPPETEETSVIDMLLDNVSIISAIDGPRIINMLR